MERFGFYAEPPIDYPGRQMLGLSGEYRNGELLPPTSQLVDVGRMAIGQDKLLVTPLQMAEVAQTIANGGVRMEPHIMRPGRRPRRPHASTTIRRKAAERVMSSADRRRR